MKYKILKKKITDRKAKICVIGLGYVGLPLIVEFAKAGFKVTGIDISKEKVRSLKQGKSYIEDVLSGDIVKISDAAQKAQEAAKYTKIAKALPEVDTEKVAEIEVKASAPGYLKNLAKDVAEKIADKLIEAIDARYEA